jgi:hypothetical protein
VARHRGCAAVSPDPRGGVVPWRWLPCCQFQLNWGGELAEGQPISRKGNGLPGTRGALLVFALGPCTPGPHVHTMRPPAHAAGDSEAVQPHGLPGPRALQGALRCQRTAGALLCCYAWQPASCMSAASICCCPAACLGRCQHPTPLQALTAVLGAVHGGASFRSGHQATVLALQAHQQIRPADCAPRRLSCWPSSASSSSTSATRRLWCSGRSRAVGFRPLQAGLDCGTPVWFPGSRAWTAAHLIGSRSHVPCMRLRCGTCLAAAAAALATSHSTSTLPRPPGPS